ncbi:homoserine O-acetyltransferase MetX [Rossellomorea vietnamensis]|uniref:homoserine O-acetyltransferase MetX n=1 Tax=Rossellomorea vietnamensis TaxID=218284 RepID=UPI001E3CDA56|nr:homoserine O-acetyltransferase [Rossellomorea vietnamensis]MCC5802122.1 homoserine O-acetyltransferase [Rossellomorea vietnamensis]
MENSYSYEVSSITIPSLTLESGTTLHNVNLAYERTGHKEGPVILVCHALTGTHIVKGTSEDRGWWDGLIGPGSYIDTDLYNVIAFNVLGGCEGSTGPTSTDPETGGRYGPDFPHITIRDMVHAQYEALQQLSVERIEAVIGGSLGGMQALEWGALYPTYINKVFALAVSPALNDYGLAFNHIGITAIEGDPEFQNGHYPHGSILKGLEIARMVGMVTYRTQELFDRRFQRERTNEQYNVESYLDYQGKKLGKRFDPNSYLTLLKAMNTHDIGRGRGGAEAVSDSYPCELVSISYEGDLIYSPHYLKEFTIQAPKGEHYFIPTAFGHDGFLVEFEKWGGIISSHLKNHQDQKIVTGMK